MCHVTTLSCESAYDVGSVYDCYILPVPSASLEPATLFPATDVIALGLLVSPNCLSIVWALVSIPWNYDRHLSGMIAVFISNHSSAPETTWPALRWIVGKSVSTILERMSHKTTQYWNHDEKVLKVDTATGAEL